jgi:hypothetical protein
MKKRRCAQRDIPGFASNSARQSLLGSSRGQDVFPEGDRSVGADQPRNLWLSARGRGRTRPLRRRSARLEYWLSFTPVLARPLGSQCISRFLTPTGWVVSNGQRDRRLSRVSVTAIEKARHGREHWLRIRPLSPLTEYHEEDKNRRMLCHRGDYAALLFLGSMAISRRAHTSVCQTRLLRETRTTAPPKGFRLV